MTPSALLRALASPLFLFATLLGCQRQTPPAESVPAARTVRVAVIGGMTSTGLWQAVATRFETASGLTVKLVATGEREACAAAFRRGEADLVTMHSGDITTNLVADGYGLNLRPWTRNDLVVVGPAADPAAIRGLQNGAEALRRIAATRTPYLDFQGIGSREVAHNLWKAAGLPNPSGSWFLPDTTTDKWSALRLAREKGACLIVGRIPMLSGKLAAEGMEILVEGDPAMRRPYAFIEADPRRFPTANAAGARALADFLLSPETQRFLAGFGTEGPGGAPLFHPVAPPPP